MLNVPLNEVDFSATMFSLTLGFVWFLGPQEAPASSDKADVMKAEVDGSVRPERIKISKGFVAKESVKGHMASSILPPSLGTVSV